MTGGVPCDTVHTETIMTGDTDMKYIFQFARLAAFCLAGELLHALLPLPVPASEIGRAHV